ncbi:MAG: ABC transporter permease [Spirochaetaceae bacterium]|jgi:ABC-2 type transport system permease protein|nr:ABC transporter permease [Spirochaetaceae bacterium]
MPVFKTFLKIVNKNKSTIIMYLAIFLGIAIPITKLIPGAAEPSYADSAEPIAVIDNDNSVISKGLHDYLKKTQRVKNIETDTDSIQDALYFRDIQFLVSIPSGYEKSLLQGVVPVLNTTSVPNSYSGIYISMQIEQYLSFLRIYLASGYTLQDAVQKAEEVLNTKADVSLVNDGKTLSQSYKFTFYYQYIPYMLLGILVQIIGLIFLSFNKEEVRRRTMCSSTTLRSRNIQLFFGCAVLGIAILAVVLLISFILYGSELSQSGVFPWLLANSLTFLVVSISLGFLVGSIVKNDNQLSALATSIAMIFSFLGGIFISQELMGNQVQKIAKFIPTYWYIASNKILGYAQGIETIDTSIFMQNIGIQVAFALAFFSLALAVSKRKSGRV